MVIDALTVASEVEFRLAAAKIFDRQRLSELSGRSVILTKGSFDIVHAGHLALISYCSRLRNAHESGALVVIVESDASMRHRKGKARPIQDESLRALQIALQPMVDAVLTSDYADLGKLIQEIKLICYVKGMDTAVNTRNLANTPNLTLDLKRNPEMSLPHASCKIVVFTDNGEISTSALIEKIKTPTN
ncbi:MAG: adenylyltransferase/cytidyltransferase family protein [Gammaproteobacteria bacterium]|nr:adenylyltransferase/cytidyltransferase family protein [Gammaproteobacteria bacterium]